MKRSRDEDGVSTCAVQFEIIYGLTKAPAEFCEAERAAACARITADKGTDLSKVFSETSTVFDGQRKVCETVVMSSLEGPVGSVPVSHGCSSPPTMVGTVRLVANDGRLLVLGGSDNAEQGVGTASVSAAAGERVFIGDVVLAKPSASVSSEMGGYDNSNQGNCHVEFLTFNASVFDDPGEWRDAATSNILAVTHWLAELLSLPPGLSQLSCIQASLLSGGGLATRQDGWARSLHLPNLLTGVSKELQSQLNPSVVQRLRRTCLSTLRVYVNILKNSELLMSMPSIFQDVLRTFVASSLFVDGLSTIVAQSAGQLLSTAWQAAAGTLADAIDLALIYVCRPIVTTHTPITAAVARENDALSGLQVLLCRISRTWLAHSRVLAQRRQHPEQPIDITTQRSALHEMLEEVAAAGVFQRVTLWLQERELGNKGTSAGAPQAFAEALQRSPSMEDLHDLHLLKPNTVTEQLATMRKTYDPFLTKHAARFLEATATAAYAELYGDAARAVHAVLQALLSGFSGDDLSGPIAEQGLAAARVRSARQLGLRAGGLAAYNLGEVRHNAEFGLPIELELADAPSACSVQKTEADECVSTFAYVLVRLQGQPLIFPVLFAVPSQDGVTTVVAYPLRDGDLLTEFVATSAAVASLATASAEGEDSEALPDAWLLLGERKWLEKAQGDPSQLSQKRLLPAGTPALTYLDLIRRLLAVRADLQRRGSVPVASGERRGASSALEQEQAHASNSLWVDFFAGAGPPVQEGYETVFASTGISPGQLQQQQQQQQALQAVMNEVTACTPLTHAQDEALLSLCVDPIGTTLVAAGDGQSSTTTATTAALSNLKIVEGVVGSGKTSVLHTAGLAKGRLLATTRREHQQSLAPQLKTSTEALKRIAVQASRASTLEEVYGQESALDLPEELASAAVEQMITFVRLSVTTRYYGAPLLLRPAAASRSQGAPVAVPPPVAHFLFDAVEDAEGENGRQGGDTRVMSPSNMSTVSRVVAESHARTLKAPLALTIDAYLRRLGELGTLCSRASATSDEEEQEDVAVYAPLMPLMMSRRDMCGTAAAAVVGAPQRSWVAYLQDMWAGTKVCATFPHDGESNIGSSNTGECTKYWQLHSAATATPGSGTFGAVRMPEGLHLASMKPNEWIAWHSVFVDKQGELLAHLREWTLQGAKTLFQWFYDLVRAVAATSQTTRHAVVLSSGAELLRGQHLPFLWVWRPSHLLLDDFEQLQDGLFVGLAPANTVTVTLQAEAPELLTQTRQLAMTALRAMRRDLQRTVALTTTALRESCRCHKAEVLTVLSRLCAVSRDGEAEGAMEQRQQKNGEEETGEEGGDGEPQEENAMSAQEDADGGQIAKPTFLGFASYSALEAWTHAVPPSSAQDADMAAAAFLLGYFRQYQGYHPEAVRNGEEDAGAPSGADRNRHVAIDSNIHVYTAHTPVSADLTPAIQSSSAISVPSAELDTALRFIPFSTDGKSNTIMTANDEESGVGIICLSAIVAHLLAESDRAGNVQNYDRQQFLSELQQRQQEEGSTMGTVAQRLRLWLWRALSKVRKGAILVGSREAFSALGLLARIEEYVQQQRRAHVPRPHLSYWLPSEVKSTVLALNCPDHYKCKRTAVVTCASDDARSPEQAESEVAITVGDCGVRVRGAAECKFLCLRCFDGCEVRSHACPHPCHLCAHSGAACEHAHCPYPCAKALPCGHLCDRTCGESCDPCTFVGLRELSCGQRVISGVGEENTVQYTFFPHFMCARCGEAPKRCDTIVSLPCPRCRTKVSIPCCDVTLRMAKAAQEARDTARASGGAVPTVAAESAVLPETECPGCVGIYNKVAQKFGFTVLPIPPSTLLSQVRQEEEEEEGDQQQLGDAHASSVDLSGRAEAGPLPLHLFSTAAQQELAREFALAAKKAELLARKEGLEISTGRSAGKISDYDKYKTECEQHRAQQVLEAQTRVDALHTQKLKWIQHLRGELEGQEALSTEIETMLPLLLDQAEAEAERQRVFT